MKQTALNSSFTSLYSCCHSTQLHKDGCMKHPCTLGGRGTPQRPGHSCCVRGHSYSSCHSWAPRSLPRTHTPRSARYTETGYSCTWRGISCPSGPRGTGSGLLVGRSWSPRSHRWSTGTVWSTSGTTSLCCRCIFH